MDSNRIEKATMSVEEMASYLGIGRNKAYEMVGNREVPALRIGRKIGIPRKPLEEWLLHEAMTMPS